MKEMIAWSPGSCWNAFQMAHRQKYTYRLYSEAWAEKITPCSWAGPITSSNSASSPSPCSTQPPVPEVTRS